MTTTLDLTSMTRALRAALPVAAEVVQVIAEQHGVCPPSSAVMHQPRL
jgi:hypothetical protein